MGTGRKIQAAKLDCWPQIKADYMSGHYSHRQLSQKYGCSEKTIQSKASREGWAAVRQAAADAAIEAALAETRAISSKTLVDVVRAAADLPERLALVLDAAGRDLSINGIKNAADALDKIQLILMRGGRIPTAAEEASQRTAAGRLQLERERLELEKQRQGTSGGVMIEIMGGDGYAE